ncbi:uncharacterized protein LOC144608248 [Rhinoraja longicauda]
MCKKIILKYFILNKRTKKRNQNRRKSQVRVMLFSRLRRGHIRAGDETCIFSKAVQADPMAGESGPENTCLHTEMTETNYELEPEDCESSDQEMIELETSGDPALENQAHHEGVSTKVIAEKTSSAKNSKVFVDGGKLNESITSETEVDCAKISVTNGTTLDGELRRDYDSRDGNGCPAAAVNRISFASQEELLVKQYNHNFVMGNPKLTQCYEKNYSFN